MLKICLTGGPCGGKSNSMSFLTHMLEERGYRVFIVPETATELILNGIVPGSEISIENFQEFVLDKQLAKENLYNRLVDYVDPAKIVIFYDRGILDNCAYIERDVFMKMLERRGMDIADVYARYDAVLHLVTAADGAEKYYQWNDPNSASTGNNAARSESPAEARAKDKKTMECWIGHPHLRVFDNSTDFNTKIKRVVEEVFSLLGEPVPKEIERKFLIKKPSLYEISKLGCVSKTQIIQTYLHPNRADTERRVRQRGTKERGFNFYYTEKTDAGHGERIECETKISPKEYIEYLSEADTTLHQISKTRYCFVYARQYFELDIYPFSDEYAILEIELNNINEEIVFPPLGIVKEVTDNPDYRNHALAATLKFQEPVNEQKSIADEESRWLYETGREEPEILGSGSSEYSVVKTYDEAEAFRLSKECGRNYINRFKKQNGKKICQWYDMYAKQWIDCLN